MCWLGIKENVWGEFFLLFTDSSPFPTPSHISSPLSLLVLLFCFIHLDVILLVLLFLPPPPFPFSKNSSTCHTHIQPVTPGLFWEAELPAVGLILLCYCLQGHRLLSLSPSPSVSLVIWPWSHPQGLLHVFILGSLWFSPQFRCLLSDETIAGLFKPRAIIVIERERRVEYKWVWIYYTD